MEHCIKQCGLGTSEGVRGTLGRFCGQCHDSPLGQPRRFMECINRVIIKGIDERMTLVPGTSKGQTPSSIQSNPI